MTDVLKTVPDLPDFLGTAGRVKTIGALLQQGQMQLVSLEAERLINGRSLDSPVGQPDPKHPDEVIPTYRERFEALNSGMAGLLAANEDIRDELIVAAVKARRDIEKDD